MQTIKSQLLCTLCVLSLLSSTVSAGVIISIDQVMVPAGSTALVGVYASSNSGDVISGFNLPLDINNNGFVDTNSDNKGDLPVGFSLSSTSIVNPLYTNTALDMPIPQISLAGVDAIPTGTGANVTLSNVPTKLFDLSVDVSSSVAPGTKVPLRILVPASPLGSLFNVAGPNAPVVTAPVAGTPVEGFIMIPVPEPNSVALSCIAGCLATLLYRRRR